MLGGVLCKETWNEYIIETLRKICEDRFEKKSDCCRFGTFDKDFERCVKSCKTRKQCEMWTNMFEEAEDKTRIVVVSGMAGQEDMVLTEDDIRGMQ
jgi:hypothetical protein